MYQRIDRRRISAVVALIALTLFAGALWAEGASQPLVMRYLPGQDYQPIDNPVDHAGDKIPVIEFFLYSCPHCYALDDAVKDWQRTLPDDVAFRRVPVLFGADGRSYARLFYTEKILDVFDRLHSKIFDAIHQQGMNLADFEAARQFFVAHGVDGERFKKVYNSPAVDKKVARAAQLMRAFKVRAVPSLGVAGHYRVTGRMAGSNEAMFAVADYLIQRARQPEDQGNKKESQS